jgi:pSer/pThr/pTyr-binding forkhead associated (FHA) protein
MWILRGSGTDVEVLILRIPHGTVKTIGRAQRADIIVDAALVSRLHCRVEASRDTLAVIDLSSTNGTFINDKRIERATLAIGDRLRVGRVELKVERTADAKRKPKS